MQQHLQECARTIVHRAEALVDTNTTTLDRMQVQALSKIYTQAQSVERLIIEEAASDDGELSENDVEVLREVLTPILGYAKLLGNVRKSALNADQIDHLDTIAVHVQSICHGVGMVMDEL